MSANQLGNALSIAFVMIIILSALMGSLKGLHKSLFQLVFSLFFLILAIIIIPYIADAMMGMNISRFKQFFPEEIQDQVTTLKATIPLWLRQTFPDNQAMFQAGSESMAMIYAVVKLVLILILLLIYFIVSMTILKLIGFIIWLFIKPDKRKVKKRKLTGALIGGARGILIVILLAVPLVGLSSIFSSFTLIMSHSSDTSGQQTESFVEEYEVFEAYQHTWVSKAFKPTNLDAHMFDFIFKIDVKIDGKKESVKIRKDLHSGAQIYDVIMTTTEGKLDEYSLLKLSNDDITTIQKHLKNTKVLKLAQVVLSEYFYETILNNHLDDGYEEITLSNLKKIDLTNDVITLLEAAKVVTKVDFDGAIEDKIFALEKADANLFIDTIATVEWLKYLMPMGLNYYLNSDQVNLLMSEYNIDSNSINKPSMNELVSDFKQIKALYGLIKDLEIEKMSDFEALFNSDSLKTLEDGQVENLVDTIFGFQILNNNLNLIAAYGHNIIESQEAFSGMISKDDFIEKLTKQEIKYIMLLGKLIIENDALSEDVDFDVLLQEENINKLAHRIAYSEIVSDVVPTLLEMMFSNNASGLTIEIPTDITFKGEPGETELKNLFKALNELIAYDMQNPSFDIDTLSDEKIRELSHTLSLSETIKHNISGIIRDLTSGRSYQFVTPMYERSYWTEDELYYTLSSFKLFERYHISEENVNVLTEAEIQTIAKSKTVTEALKKEIEKMNGVGGVLENKLVIPDGLTWHSLDETGEIEHLVLAIKAVQGTQPFTTFNPSIDGLFGKDKDLIFRSQIILHTLTENHLKPLVNVTMANYFEPKDFYGNEYDWYGSPSDAVDFVKALDDLSQAGIDYKVMDYALFISVLQSDPQKPRAINDALVQSKIFMHSMSKMLHELINIQGGNSMTIHQGDPSYWGTKDADGELLNLLTTLGGH